MRSRAPTVRELQRMVPFPLETVRRLASGERVRRSEKSKETPEHKELIRCSARYFKAAGYAVKRRPFSVPGVYAAADYGVVSQDGQFAFVECLSRLCGPRVVGRKLQLAKYAPLWFVISEGSRVERFIPRRYPWVLVLRPSGEIRARVQAWPVLE